MKRIARIAIAVLILCGAVGGVMWLAYLRGGWQVALAVPAVLAAMLLTGWAIAALVEEFFL